MKNIYWNLTDFPSLWGDKDLFWEYKSAVGKLRWLSFMNKKLYELQTQNMG